MEECPGVMRGPRDSRVCPHHHLDVSVVDGDAADVGGGLPIGNAFLIQLTASQDEAWGESGSTLPPSPQLDPTPVQEAHPRFPGRSPLGSDPRAPRSRALPQASRWEQGLHRAGLLVSLSIHFRVAAASQELQQGAQDLAGPTPSETHLHGGRGLSQVRDFRVHPRASPVAPPSPEPQEQPAA